MNLPLLALLLYPRLTRDFLIWYYNCKTPEPDRIFAPVTSSLNPSARSLPQTVIEHSLLQSTSAEVYPEIRLDDSLSGSGTANPHCGVFSAGAWFPV